MQRIWKENKEHLYRPSVRTWPQWPRRLQRPAFYGQLAFEVPPKRLKVPCKTSKLSVRFRSQWHFNHGVWKSQKKSHSTLRAKRATFTFRVDKSSLKMPKMVHFGEFLKTWSLRLNSVTRQVSFNRTKNGVKCQNSNATFWVIFKQCVLSCFQCMFLARAQAPRASTSWFFSLELSNFVFLGSKLKLPSKVDW